MAWPFAAVTTVALSVPPKLALAPRLGAVKVTVTPESGLPVPSFTIATKGFWKAVLTVAVCPIPFIAESDSTPPAGLIVSVRFAVAVDPLLSVTLNVRGVFAAVSVGVPLICPVVGVNVSPPGRTPEVTAHVYGVVPPVAVRVCE